MKNPRRLFRSARAQRAQRDGASSSILPHGFDLDAALLKLTKHPRDRWTMRDACEGALILGATGSGKTSGPGEALSSALLASGAGGLVLTVKADEAALWRERCQRAGRASDLMVMNADGVVSGGSGGSGASGGGGLRFNFLDYVARASGGGCGGAGLTHNCVSIFYTLLEAAERSSGQGSQGYWMRTAKQMLGAGIDLLRMAGETLTIANIMELVLTGPRSVEEANDEAWKASSFCHHCLLRAAERIEQIDDESLRQDFDVVASYWLIEFPQLAGRTRSVIVSSLTSMIDPFLRSPLRELFCTTTNLIPEHSAAGAIIVIDLPVKTYGEVGRLAQLAFKLCWQGAMERRAINASTRPVFLWADEAQEFVVSEDFRFQTTARSARVASVLLTQSIANIHAALGDSPAAKHLAASILGNLNTRFFCANGCDETNKWAADQIGRNWGFRSNVSSTRSNDRDKEGRGAQQGAGSSSGGASESLDHDVLPSAFTRLRTGGPRHNFLVDCIAMQVGRQWHGAKKNHLRLVFEQRRKNQ